MPFALPVPPALLGRMAHLDRSVTATEEEVIAMIDSSAILSAEVMRAAARADRRPPLGPSDAAAHTPTAAERAPLPGLDATLIRQAARFALREVKGTLGLYTGGGLRSTRAHASARRGR